MVSLGDRMEEEMKLRNLSPRTIKAYLGEMRRFTKMFGKYPAKLGETEVREYLKHLREELKLSTSSIYMAYSALRFFYTNVLHQDFVSQNISYPRKEKKLPAVLSKQEVKAILDSCSNLKYKTILMGMYSSGCRVSEITKLKISDIDSDRKQIRVEQGKGKKDRYTTLSDVFLETLREYWRVYSPTEYFFTPYGKNQPLGVSVVQVEFRKAKKKPTF